VVYFSSEGAGFVTVQMLVAAGENGSALHGNELEQRRSSEMDFPELVLKNRSYRRFQGDYRIECSTLEGLVDLARLTASPMNRQPLKYMLSCDAERNDLIFSCLGWAAYLTDWEGPGEGERPSAYILVLGDKSLSESFGADYGIAAQTITLGATSMGLGGCVLSSIRRDVLRRALAIPDKYEILIAIALGRPQEQVVIEGLDSSGSTRYWRDEDGVHHVPKRGLEEIIIG
jgi:nitroreductase